MFIGPEDKTGNRRTGRDIALRSPCGAARCLHHRGFTLMEIMLAVAILGMMSMAIFRFVQSNMIALQLSSDTAAGDAQYDGLRDLLTAEWQSLSPLRANMVGEPFKLDDRERDEIKWRSTAGPGLLTRYAPGDFTVVLRLQPENEKGSRLDLGFSRKAQEDSDTGEARETWVPLIKWLPRWPLQGRLPLLVRITVGRTDSAVPWETIIPLRRTPY